MKRITTIRLRKTSISAISVGHAGQQAAFAALDRTTMATVSVPLQTSSWRTSWRTPTVIVGCGCLIAMLSFGPRSAVGQFLTPMSLENHWGRDVFAFALAIQNLLWGAFQPFAGGVADRYGAVRVLWTGAIAYAAGLVLMSQASTPGLLDL